MSIAHVSEFRVSERRAILSGSRIYNRSNDSTPLTHSHTRLVNVAVVERPVLPYLASQPPALTFFAALQSGIDVLFPLRNLTRTRTLTWILTRTLALILSSFLTNAHRRTLQILGDRQEGPNGVG
jgi:hypothetical protein